MKLLAGLGNPGRSYSRHRHNAGFFVLDEIAARHGIKMARRSFGAVTGSGAVAGESVLLAKPMQYMNLSGESIKSLLGYYKLGVESLIVVHDDIDIEAGRIKIIENLGSKDFVRVRVGVGRPPEGIDGADYVLTPFLEEERGTMAEAFSNAAEAVEIILKDGLLEAQQRYH